MPKISIVRLVQASAQVRSGSKAEMALRKRDVRFTPESGHSAARP
jgi:hypothetical protein